MAVDLTNLIDLDLLSYFKTKLDLLFANKVDKVDGKGLSTNDYTADEKAKLANIASGAQVNVLEGIQKNGATISAVNKIVNISVPTKTSDLTNDSNFAVDSNYVHTDNNYTTAEKNKLAGIASNAQVNVIESVKVNGATATVSSKTVNISVPSKTSDITNDSGFITAADVPEGATAATEAPLMDGVAATGSSLAFARGDHVHPADTSKVDKVEGKGLSTNDYTTAEQSKLAGIASGAQVNVIESVKVNGTAQTVSSKAVNIAVPSKTSDLTNNSNFAVDSAYVHTDNNYTTADKNKLNAFSAASSYYTKSEIDQKLSGAMNYKGTKATVAALPSTGNAQGDVWHVNADGGEYAWNGSAWEELGTAIDLSGYVVSSDLGLATASQIDELFT